jgi:hypothetical protein
MDLFLWCLIGGVQLSNLYPGFQEALSIQLVRQVFGPGAHATIPHCFQHCMVVIDRNHINLCILCHVNHSVPLGSFQSFKSIYPSPVGGRIAPDVSGQASRGVYPASYHQAQPGLSRPWGGRKLKSRFSGYYFAMMWGVEILRIIFLYNPLSI